MRQKKDNLGMSWIIIAGILFTPFILVVANRVLYWMYLVSLPSGSP